MKTQNNSTKYSDALKHITALKEFYQHLFVYAIFIVIWFIYKEDIVEFVVAKTPNFDSGFLYWLNINIALVPVLWAIGILIQWLYINNFKFSLFKKWEDKKLMELMNEENNELTITQNDK